MTNVEGGWGCRIEEEIFGNHFKCDIMATRGHKLSADDTLSERPNNDTAIQQEDERTSLDQHDIPQLPPAPALLPLSSMYSGPYWTFIGNSTKNGVHLICTGSSTRTPQTCQISVSSTPEREGMCDEARSRMRERVPEHQLKRR